MTSIPYLSTKEAALKIGISEQRVRTLLRSGDIKGQQVGKVWVLEPEAVEELSCRQDNPGKSSPSSQSHLFFLRSYGA